MSEAWQIVLTASATLFGGMILFISGEFVRTLVIKPLQKYKEHVETILDRLDFYADFYTRIFKDSPTTEEISKIENYISHMRSAASQLNAKYSLIGWKRYLIFRSIIPSQEDNKAAHASLIRLSHSVLFESRVRDKFNPTTNSEEADKVKALLR